MDEASDFLLFRWQTGNGFSTAVNYSKMTHLVRNWKRGAFASLGGGGGQTGCAFEREKTSSLGSTGRDLELSNWVWRAVGNPSGVHGIVEKGCW